MTPSDASFFKVADLAAPLAMLVTGILLLTTRRQQDAARQARVERGEITAAEAAAKAKLVSKCGVAVIVLCVGLIAVWVMERLAE